MFEICHPRVKVVLLSIEVIPLLLVPLAAYTFLVLLAVGIAQGHGRMEGEEEYLNRPKRKIEGRTPTPKQTIDPSETIAKSSERAAASIKPPSGTICVRSVMHRQPYYCFENQSMDEALELMRELHVPKLVVLDERMRVVGMVKMEDLIRAKKQDPPPPDLPPGA